MGKMHELLAVEADLANTAKAVMDEALTTFSKKAEHFMGSTRTLTHFDAARAGEDTAEQKAMVTTVDDKLGYVLGKVAPYWDALFQKEATNQDATADLEIDGVTIASNVPATFLLGMESRLKGMRDLILAIPTLNPNQVWVEDPTLGDGVYRSESPPSMRTEKTLRYKVMVDATDRHPAQVEKWNEDVAVARIEVKLQSGMWTVRRKSEVLDNVDKLLEAVKKARQRANLAEVDTRKVASALVNAILDGADTHPF